MSWISTRIKWLAEGFFAEINPLNLPPEKLKEQLAGEVGELKIELASFRSHPEKIMISPGYTELVGIWETNRQYFKFSVAMLL